MLHNEITVTNRQRECTNAQQKKMGSIQNQCKLHLPSESVMSAAVNVNGILIDFVKKPRDHGLRKSTSILTSFCLTFNFSTSGLCWIFRSERDHVSDGRISSSFSNVSPICYLCRQPSAVRSYHLVTVSTHALFRSLYRGKSQHSSRTQSAVCDSLQHKTFRQRHIVHIDAPRRQF